jgi:hypothetical protein
MVAITYRDALGRRLTAAEVDANFKAVADAIVALQNDRPQPNDIESIGVVGAQMTITLTDGTKLGPFQLPVLAFRWRSAWEPFTDYKVLDTFTVEGFGIYTVMADHTSGATFDPALMVSTTTPSSAAYQQLFGSDATGTAVIYDIAFFYQALISDSGADNLFEFPAPRQILLPAVGDQHEARLKDAPSTAAQVFPVLHNGTQIGHIDFAIGENTGTVTINADETILRGDLLELGSPALSDATAKGLSVVFAAQRIL